MFTKVRSRALIAMLAVASVLAVAVGAQAAKVTGGSTTLTPSAQATKVLSASHISFSAIAPGKLQSGSLVLPIARGHLNAKLRGTLFHKGGIKISNGKRTVPVRHLVVRSGKRGAYVLAVARVPRKIARKIRQIRRHHARHHARKHARAARLLRKRILVVRVFKLVNPVRSQDGKSVTATAKATPALALVFNRLAGKHIVSAGQTVGTITVAPTLGS